MSTTTRVEAAALIWIKSLELIWIKYFLHARMYRSTSPSHSHTYTQPV
jgi:hypothetical protein